MCETSGEWCKKPLWKWKDSIEISIPLEQRCYEWVTPQLYYYDMACQAR
jgi:hypothetical protein